MAFPICVSRGSGNCPSRALCRFELSKRNVAMAQFLDRAANKVRRVLTSSCAKDAFALSGAHGYVSFTLDDFPTSAARTGGAILNKHGAAGTYYVALGLMGKPSPSGPIASAEDIRWTIETGHELGCHTFGHLNGAECGGDVFVESIRKNREHLLTVVPGVRFADFAYPFDGPGLSVKRAVRGLFRTCRGGGQAIKEGVIDLALLKGFFVDARNARDVPQLEEVLRRTVERKGWLIFATHDVCEAPSRFGCTPRDFENIVRMATSSGATVLPVAGVCDAIGVRPMACA